MDLVVTTPLAVGAGTIVTLQTPSKYESTVTFFVRTPAEQIGGAYRGDQFAQKLVNSYVQLLGRVRRAQLVLTDTQSTNMAPTRGADSYRYGYYDDASGARPQLADDDAAPVVVGAKSGCERVKVAS